VTRPVVNPVIVNPVAVPKYQEPEVKNVKYSSPIKGLDDDDNRPYRSTGDLGGDEGYTPLILACKDGALPQVQDMLKKGEDCNSRTSEGRTALWYAAKGNHTHVVSALLNVWADVTTLDREGNSASDVTINSAIQRAINERRKLKSLFPKPENRKLAFMMSAHPRLADPIGFAKKQAEIAAEKAKKDFEMAQQAVQPGENPVSNSNSQPGESKAEFSVGEQSQQATDAKRTALTDSNTSTPTTSTTIVPQQVSNVNTYVAPVSSLMLLEPKTDRMNILNNIFQFMGRYG
jgi:hypothetical protein